MPPRTDTPSSLVTDREAARAASRHVDELVRLAQTDPDLRMACVKFQMEHAAAMAGYDAGASGAEEVHLEAMLRRMLELATGTAAALLQRVQAGARSPVSPPCAPPATAATGTGSHPSSAVNSPTSAASAHARGFASFDGMDSAPRSSSVDDLNASDLVLERNASLMQHACRVAAVVFLVSQHFQTRLQQYGLDIGLLDVVRDALRLPRNTELRCFAEGFRTEFMNVLSNFTFGHPNVCDAVAADEDLVRAIMGATRIDEENPGLVEWAEFALRNICGMSGQARDVVKAQRALTKPTYMPAPAPTSSAAVSSSVAS